MNKLVQAAIDKRDAFLREHPELTEYQKEIQRRLSKAGYMKNRVGVLGFMLEERVSALDKAVKDSHKAVKELL